MLDISPFISSTPPTDWLRLVLLYSHLVCCAFALALVLSADWRILKGDYTTRGLKQMAHNTSAVLVLLWVSGGLLIYHDTGLDLVVISGMSKLQLKLIIVVALTVNGLVLHHVSFPIMIRKRRKNLLESLFLSVSGAISSSHWLLAAFIGIAKPLGEWPLETLLRAYTLYVSATLAVAIVCAPFMQIHLNRCFNARRLERRSERRNERRNERRIENRREDNLQVYKDWRENAKLASMSIEPRPVLVNSSGHTLSRSASRHDRNLNKRPVVARR